MNKLSQQAQAVLDAFGNASDGEYVDGVWVVNERAMLAAVLRAVAEQGATFYWWDNYPVQAVTVGSLLAIATELEAQ